MKLPEETVKAFLKRDKVGILTTVNSRGVPNTVYVSCYGLFEDEKMLIGDVAFSKTLENIQGKNPYGTFLFWAKELAAYQLKGTLSYHTEGPLWEAGQELPEGEFSLRGVVALNVEVVYKGAECLGADGPQER